MILIYGASGHAHELANLAWVCGYRLASYVDDLSSGPLILGLEEAKAQFLEAPILLGVGFPAIRRRLAERSRAAGFEFLSKLVHPRVDLSSSVQIGIGSVISESCVLTVNIHIGEQTHLNIASSVSHDVWIGDYVTLSPGVRICGNVRIESDVFVGAGAVIINGMPNNPIVVGEGATIGAGACVTKSVPAGETWVGVPARKL
jgi:sugar O-acyltransferase (sialic acid O-acetyltransferase NeuD family)